MPVKMSLQFFKLCFIFSFLVVTKGENNECGVVAKPKGNRIVGGEIIGYMKYPWFAALFLTGTRQLVCGGSLISKRYVLTASHCYKPFFEKQKQGEVKFEDIYDVKLGVDNTCIQEKGIQTYATSKVYIHETYFEDLLYYDISLLLLDNEVNDFIPVCLPLARYESNNRTGLEASIIGLGKESSTAWRLPCQMKESKVITQTDAICRSFLSANKEDGERLHDAFCAGNGQGVTDTCQGDSGGPLQVEMEDTRIMILGITSFGYGCAKKDTFGVYTDVSHFLDWIHNKMDSNKNSKVIAKDIRPTTTTSTVTSVVKTAQRVQRKKRPTNILQQILNW